MPAVELTATDVASFLNRALERVESASIRAWARSEHNLPLMLELARLGLAKRGDNQENEIRFATFVTCEAMGF